MLCPWRCSRRPQPGQPEPVLRWVPARCPAVGRERGCRVPLRACRAVRVEQRSPAPASMPGHRLHLPGCGAGLSPVGRLARRRGRRRRQGTGLRGADSEHVGGPGAFLGSLLHGSGDSPAASLSSGLPLPPSARGRCLRVLPAAPLLPGTPWSHATARVTGVWCPRAAVVHAVCVPGTAPAAAQGASLHAAKATEDGRGAPSDAEPAQRRAAWL